MSKIIRITLAAVLSSSFLAGPAKAEPIAQALAKAYQNNSNLLAARERLKSTAQQYQTALSGFRPNISLNGTKSTTHSELAIPKRAGRQVTSLHPTTGSVDVSQSIFAGGETVAAISVADNQVLAEKENLRDTEQQVLLATINSYVSVLKDERLVEINKNNERVFAKELESARIKLKLGDGTKADVARAEASYAKALAGTADAKAQLETSRAAYKRIIGEAPEKLERVKAATDLPEDFESLIDQAMKNHPSILKAKFSEDAQSSDIDQKRSRFLPRVDLSGQIRRSFETNVDDDRTTSKQLQAALKIPLYQQGAEYADIRSSTLKAAEAKMNVETARRQVIEGATKSWESLKAAAANVDNFKAQLRAQEVDLAGTRQEFQVGTKVLLDVLNAEQKRLEAEVNLAEAEKKYLVSSYELKAAVGHLNVRDLGVEVERFDADEYYQNVKGRWFGI